MPGLRSVLWPVQKFTHFDPKERHALEREALARRHAREKLEIARVKRAQARIETREKQALEKRLQRAARKLENKARQEFNIAAHDPAMRSRTEIEEGELSVNFNDAADFVEGAGRAGDDDDDRAPGWKQRAEERAQGLKQRRGKRLASSRLTHLRHPACDGIFRIRARTRTKT